MARFKYITIRRQAMTKNGQIKTRDEEDFRAGNMWLHAPINKYPEKEKEKQEGDKSEDIKEPDEKGMQKEEQEEDIREEREVKMKVENEG